MDKEDASLFTEGELETLVDSLGLERNQNYSIVRVVYNDSCDCGVFDITATGNGAPVYRAFMKNGGDVFFNSTINEKDELTFSELCDSNCHQNFVSNLSEEEKNLFEYRMSKGIIQMRDKYFLSDVFEDSLLQDIYVYQRVDTVFHVTNRRR